MISCTDPLNLNEHRLFKELKNGLPKSAKETRNILEVRDDVLYVWNAEDCCILTLNIAATCSKPGEEVRYQVSAEQMVILMSTNDAEAADVFTVSILMLTSYDQRYTTKSLRERLAPYHAVRNLVARGLIHRSERRRAHAPDYRVYVRRYSRGAVLLLCSTRNFFRVWSNCFFVAETFFCVRSKHSA